MKELGYARDYKYAHSYEGNFTDQDYLPQTLKARYFMNLRIMPGKMRIRNFSPDGAAGTHMINRKALTLSRK
jgi:putative ATPase